MGYAKYRIKKITDSLLTNINSRIRMVLVLLVSTQTTTWAQNSAESGKMNPSSISPVMIESVVGNHGLNLQTIFSKNFAPSSRFGVFGIADLYGVYEAKEQPVRNQQMAQTHITFKIARGLNLSAGAFFENHSGFRPTVGLQYNLLIKDFHLLLAPRFDLSQTYNGELLGFVAYTPRITGDWKIYSRVQTMYNRDLKNDMHSISYLWARLGVSYRNYRFGAGGNWYWLGPHNTTEENLGLFLGVLLF